MTSSAEPQFELTLESVRYQLIGSGLEAALVDTAPCGRGRAKAWRCSACQADFPTARHFDAHVGRHADVCLRQCHLCDARLVGGVAQLQRHLASHTAGRRHACRRCGRAFRSAVDLLQHQRLLHAAIYRFRCDTCPRSYRSRPLLRTHCLTHATAPRPLACSVCGQALLSVQERRSHERAHRCHWPGCSYLGRHLSNVRTHMDSVHRKVKRFQCQQCTKGFFTLSVLNLHVRRVHGERSAEFRCKVCDSVFKSRGGLFVHRRVHVTRRDQVCPLCANSFRSTQALERHVADHMTAQGKPFARPFACECGDTFRSTLTLRRHRVRHQWVRQQQRHRYQLQLQQQRQRTTDVTARPHPTNSSAQDGSVGPPPPAGRPSIFCLECGEEFDSGQALEFHYQEMHWAAGPFHCPDCGCWLAKARLFAHHRVEMHMQYVIDSVTIQQPVSSAAKTKPQPLAAVDMPHITDSVTIQQPVSSATKTKPQQLATVDMPHITDPSPLHSSHPAGVAGPGLSHPAGVAGPRPTAVPDSNGPCALVPANITGNREWPATRAPDRGLPGKPPRKARKRKQHTTSDSKKRAPGKTQRNARTTSSHTPCNKLTSKREELDSEDADGVRASAGSRASGCDSRDEPALAARRPRRVTAARGAHFSIEELYNQVLGSSSEHADDTVSDWEPGASDSDRELLEELAL